MREEGGGDRDTENRKTKYKPIEDIPKKKIGRGTHINRRNKRQTYR